MGIKSLTKLIKKNAMKSIKNESLTCLRDKTVAVDASLFIYKSLMTINTEYNGKEIGHIIGILNKTVNYLMFNITPIYIFDGKAPDEKRTTLDERNKRANLAKKNMELSNNIEDKQKYKKRSIRLTKNHINDVKELLQALGVSYIHLNKGEAEGIASELSRINYVDYVVTEDMDALTFGCKKLVRSCIDKSYKRKDIVSIFDLNILLAELNITHDEFIELCILCGCDYCKNIPKIGICKSLDIIHRYKTIDNFITSSKMELPDNYIEQYQSSIKIFNSYKDIFNQGVPIQTFPMDKYKLIELLKKSCNMNPKKINNIIMKLDKFTI